MTSDNELESLRQATRNLISLYFKDQKTGKPFIAKDGQCDIFNLITDPSILRGQVETPTQYGKSQIIAFAVLWLIKAYSKKIILIAPTNKQAGIIMDYIIHHVFDNPLFQEGLNDAAGLEKMKSRRSKDRLSWSDGGDVRVLSAEARTASGAMGAMGFGGDVIIIDECALIPSDHFAKIIRMLGGDVHNSKLIKVGNPWDSKHFDKTRNSKRYTKIWIDWKQAVREGRFTEDFIEEMREGMDKEDFRVLFEVRPPRGKTKGGIFTHDIVETLKIQRKLAMEQVGVYGGLDVAGDGDDDTIFSLIESGVGGTRLLEQAEILSDGDTHKAAKKVHKILDKRDDVIALGIDVVGMGKGVADYMFNIPGRKYEIEYYTAGSKAKELQYYNIKSELIFGLRYMAENKQVDLSNGSGQLYTDLLGFGKRKMADRRIKSEDPKDSPDYADSLLAAIAAANAYGQVNIEFF